MSGWIAYLIVLAENSRYHSLGSRFRGRRARMEFSDLLTVLAVFLVIGITAYLLSRLVRRIEGKRPYDSPRRLFRQLSAAHGLDRSSRRLLSALASSHRLAQPAQIFLSPDCFEPSHLAANLQSRRDEIQRLRDRLFGETIEIAESSAGSS